jgi:hypothetical protein
VNNVFRQDLTIQSYATVCLAYFKSNKKIIYPFVSFYSFLNLSNIKLVMNIREKQMLIINRKQFVYFVFWVVAGGCGTGSTAAVPFFDFITIATMRCSSIRKARTILKTKVNFLILKNQFLFLPKSNTFSTS